MKSAEEKKPQHELSLTSVQMMTTCQEAEDKSTLSKKNSNGKIIILKGSLFFTIFFN